MNSYEKENNENNPQFIFLEKIKAMFITIIEKERINNTIKISLSNNPNINIQHLFDVIDLTKKNYIDLNDLKKFFELNSLSYNEQIIRRFIHIFDKHNNFYLIYEDFLKIFIPYTKNGIYNEYNIMSEKEMELNILNNYLELIEQINDMIINIRNTNNFTTYEAFMGITKGNKYLDEEFLIHFLEHNYNSEEIKNIIYLFDSDNDCLISYDEFQEFFFPLVQGNKIYNEEIDLDDNNKINIENNNDIVNYEKSGKCPKKISENKDENNNNEFNEIEKKEEINDNNNINISDNDQENNQIIKNDNNNMNNIDENNDNKKLNPLKEKEKNVIEKNNNYELNLSSDDYDNYCNFYRKTKQILSSPSKKNDSNQINTNKTSENSPEKAIENKNSEIKIIKKEDTALSEKEKQYRNDINTEEKENDLININNFTCRKKTGSDIDNSSPKKVILNINSNDLENYSLSNDYNNIISKSNSNNRNILSDCNILSSNNENEKNSTSKEQNNKINILKENDNQINENKSITNFIKYIQFILTKEKHTMDIKDNLSLREDISLKSLFCIFDYNKKNKISKKEFKVVCKKILGLYPTSDQVNLVYKRYDKDKDNDLNLKEFLNMIKPLKEEYACFLFNKEKNNNDNINMKSKKMLTDVIRAVIEDEGNYYKFKYDLENQNLFDLNEFWNTIKKYENDKGIDKLEMNKFLNDFGCSLNEYEIDIIFNKIDYDKDDIISYDDLTQEFLYYY